MRACLPRRKKNILINQSVAKARFKHIFEIKGVTEMSSEDPIGKRIHDRREAKKISQSQLAKLVGITPATIWNWETRGTHPRPETLAKVAAVLEVSEDFLSDAQEEKPYELPMRRVSIPKVIENAKADIAALTGCDVSHIKIQVTFED
jgi:transcriptional regulator with XRE-family HTH domain